MLDLAASRKLPLPYQKSSIYNLASELMEALRQERVKAIGRSQVLHLALNFDLYSLSPEDTDPDFLEHSCGFFLIPWQCWTRAEVDDLLQFGTIRVPGGTKIGNGPESKLIGRRIFLWVDIYVNMSEVIPEYGGKESFGEKIKPESKNLEKTGSGKRKNIRARIIEMAEAAGPKAIKKKLCRDQIIRELNTTDHYFQNEWYEAKNDRPDLNWPRPGRDKEIDN